MSELVKEPIKWLHKKGYFSLSSLVLKYVPQVKQDNEDISIWKEKVRKETPHKEPRKCTYLIVLLRMHTKLKNKGENNIKEKLIKLNISRVSTINTKKNQNLASWPSISETPTVNS